ncbi:MAG: NAD-glutamate dehydrogenase [Alphaproteobacteria bacterium]
MATSRTVLKTDLIERVAGLAAKKLGKAMAAETEAFVRAFYDHVPPDDIASTDPADLFGAALAFWKFAAEREPEKPKIRVFNPNFDDDGWKSVHTVIEIVNDDMPFLVDSVAAELSKLELTVHLVIHPIFRVQRDAKGHLTEIHPAAEGGKNGAAAESFMHIQIDEQTGKRGLAEIEQALHKVLGDVRMAVADWQPIRAKVKEAQEALDHAPKFIDDKAKEEITAFLDWLDDDHFTFLGYREYEVSKKGKDSFMGVVDGSGLGLLRDPDVHVFEGVRRLADLPQHVRDFLERKQLLIVNKANMRSTVHRGVHLDAIGLKEFDKSGEVARERLFVGLFTSTVYSRSPRFIPVLRTKIERMVERAGFEMGSHDGKALLHILETFPRDELFQVNDDELFNTSLGILHLQERHRTALFVRQDAFERFISCLVFVPRDRHDTALRQRFSKILEAAFNGPITAFQTQIGDESVLARVHFIVKTEPGAIPDYNVAEIEALLVEASRSWGDELRDALIHLRGEDKGLKLFRRYGEAFPTAYEERFDAQYALTDIAKIEDALETNTMALNLYRPIEAPDTAVRFKIYHSDDAVALSDVLPMLENMGLRVMDEMPYQVAPAGQPEVWIHDFGVVRRDGGAIALGEIREAFEDSFARIWLGEMENDGFNRLVIGAGLHWRAIVILRALAKYLRQAAIPFSQAYMEDTLDANTELAQLLVELFEKRFHPEEANEAAEKKITARIEAGLEEVESLDEDRIIRRFMNLVQAALRTNFYQPAADAGHKPYLSIKFDSGLIDELPLPRPFREIFVYSPRVEGIHLRGGKVARGGLRWSDRREDFRTEILGLMKAQMVKNAVIVPVGSKGGFVVKQPPADPSREAQLAEGVECYKTFLCGLLDLTDNRVGDDIVPPTNVVRHDDEDPYLVVAADKGTATFSDYANGVSDDYGFWLGDAFASGGSVGYDHKKMGITARGAWEAVKRHFREIGKDIQTEDFTVVGVGDMSGDVFGNGMLLSEHIKLIGAFNHLHIFVDPDPDPKKSFAERKRLFDLPRSNWTDYEAKLISKGGGIFERKAKSIALTPEVKASFDLKKDKVTPNELIRAMLKADAELLWFGGIGTYVKSSKESNAEVGDRATDALRVDATELQAKVVGEGANLGVTQRGRIEFAQHGGRLNSDAIDNSAGVDCSDHEVNIKILLGQVVQAGDMTMKQRNELLETMTDEVGALVLRDNYLQTQALSLVEAMGATRLDLQVQFMKALERENRLDRAIEFLPDDEEVADRDATKRGLTRPELSVLLAYAKIVLIDQLLDPDLPDDPLLEQDLIAYFPKPLHEPYRAAINQHRLKREIISTYVTNSIVNRAGPTFIHELGEKSGMAPADVARAYLVARDVFQLRDSWRAIEALDNTVSAEVQIEMLSEARQLIERTTFWFLRGLRQPIDVRGVAESFRPGIAALWKNLDKVLTGGEQAKVDARAKALAKKGVPAKLAERVAAFDTMASACDIVRLAGGRERDMKATAALYFTLGKTFGLDWLREQAERLGAGDYWNDLAVTSLVEDLYGHQFQLCQSVLEAAGDTPSAAEAVAEAWADARRPMVDRLNWLLGELRGQESVDLAMLAVANRQIRALVSS